MCYRVEEKVTKPTLESRFAATMNGTIVYTAEVFAFDNPKVPIILDRSPSEIVMSHWGLIPSWAKDDEIRQKTNNARYDELMNKKSYKDVKNQRCLILVSGFYEHHHLPGGELQMYLMKAIDERPFAIGGIWSDWTDPISGNQLNTFSMLTTEARGVMKEVHNNGQRQPLLLNSNIERDWLHTPYNPNDTVPDFELTAVKYGKEPNPNLFGDLFN